MAALQRIRKLGNGSFGEVWLCHERALGVDRAVKFIPSANIVDATDFYAEARMMALFEHENIVRVYDAGDAPQGGVYISMEYLRNGSAVDEQDAVGLVPIRRARSLVAGALRGLEYLHSQDHIHCDVKPGNILVGDTGRAKLSDFGLVTQLSADGRAQLGIGYEFHLAPETWQTDEVSVASDIYAAGLTLFRLVDGDSSLPQLAGDALREAVVRGSFITDREFLPFVTRRLRNVVKKAIATDPDHRYSSAAEFRHALEQVPLEADWTWGQLPDGRTAWSGTSNAHRAEVTVQPVGPRVRVDVTSARHGSAFRRCVRHCQEVSRSKLPAHLRKVLSEFTETGHF